MDLTQCSDLEVLRLWTNAMAELRRRNVIRSSNNPVADYAEHLVAAHLDLTLEPNANPGYDARDTAGIRYQIKARRLRPKHPSRQLGAMRNLHQDCFDVLIVVLFNQVFEVEEMWSLPIDLVREHADFKEHVNAHILHAQGAVLADPRAKQLV